MPPTYVDEAIELARLRRLTKSGQARAIRLAADLSQQEVAQLVGVSGAAVSRWEAGIRSPRGKAALRYAQVLSGLIGG